MTGGAAGFCAGYTAPGFVNSIAGEGYRGRGRGGWGHGGPGRGGGWGRGGGCGRGGGRGHRNWYYATGLTGWQRAAAQRPSHTISRATPFAPTVTKEHELDALKKQADYFADAVDRIKKQIQEIESENEAAKTD
jgi:hypothetical protein